MASIAAVVEKYQEILNKKPGFKFSGNRPTFGAKGVGNRIFYLNLYNDQELFLAFLKETGLLKNKMICSKCNGEMKMRVCKKNSDGLTWFCNKRPSDGNICHSYRSVRYGSWFSSSKLKLQEIMILTYEFIIGTETNQINREYNFSSHTLSNWRQIVQETILDFVENSSEKIGGAGKEVQIDISKFGKRKFKKGHHVAGQWFMGGLERGSGNFFLVALQDRSKETLVNAIKEWMEPGTNVSSDNGLAHSSLGEEGIQYLTVNHDLNFMDLPSEKCKNGTETEDSLSTYNHRADYLFHMATFLFKKSCKEKNVDLLNQFLEFITDVNMEGITV